MPAMVMLCQLQQDVSDFRPVPDHQEVWADAESDRSVVVEILERQAAVADADAAVFLFNDLAEANEATGSQVEVRAAATRQQAPLLPPGVHVSTLRGTQRVAKHRDAREAANDVCVSMAVARMREQESELCVVLSAPTRVSEQSSTAHAAHAAQGEGGDDEIRVREEETLAVILASLRINDMRLFGG